MTSSNFSLKVKTKDRNIEIKDSLSLETKLTELQNIISEAAGIASSNLKVLFGYPRKALNFGEFDNIKQAGIKPGDTLFVEESTGAGKASTQSTASGQDSSNVLTSSDTPKNISNEQKSHISDVMPREVKGILLKKEVPSDNSCLFTSLAFVLSGKIDVSTSSFMRQLVADKISSQPDEYSDAILGKPNKEYCTWILNPNSWGGAIELAVLSDHYGFEIAVVNSVTGVISRFGEDKHYDHRVFLLFDGIHYDPLYMDFIQTENMQTIFPTSDEDALRDAQQLAREAKESRQFTDVNQFMICCTQCNAILVGQLEAQKHAEQTGHTKFDEVSK
ncbi:ubiquitin thioesterase OTU1 [Planococcus citri]|uniref:ubiquitin thioesterase OTU1 n=1 Tax=Planococcus citri TaxID=170843 RepID=UPI0031F92ED5